jgi:hypothetical protein
MKLDSGFYRNDEICETLSSKARHEKKVIDSVTLAGYAMGTLEKWAVNQKRDRKVSQIRHQLLGDGRMKLDSGFRRNDEKEDSGMSIAHSTDNRAGPERAWL